jgi:hypothetical protein
MDGKSQPEIEPAPSSFARALVLRLRPQIPELVRLDAVDAAVVISVEDVRSSVEVGRILEQPGELSGRLEVAGLSVLNQLQDVVIRATKKPWPESNSEGENTLSHGVLPHRAAAPVPYPQAKVLNDKLRLWYGPEDQPSLAFEALPLSELFEAD